MKKNKELKLNNKLIVKTGRPVILIMLFGIFVAFMLTLKGTQIALTKLGVDPANIDIAAKHIIATIIPGVVIFFLLLIFAMYLIVKLMVAKPITEALHHFQDLNSEDQTADLTKRIETKKNDEIGEMCREVNTFIGSQHSLISTIAESGNKITDVVQNLAVASQEVAGNVNQIMNNIRTVKSAVGNQGTALTGVQKLLEENINGVSGFDVLI